MPNTHLLDTSVFSQPVKDSPIEASLTHWRDLGDPAVCTSAVCIAEILQGLEFRNSQKYWRRYRELLEDRYEALPFDQSVAVTFARMAADLRRAGNPRPALDLMIAATAKHHSLIIATLNARDFMGIPGIGVEDWSDQPS